MPAFEIKNRVPAEVWNSYFKFCVERNPWDKVLSHFNMHATREGGSLRWTSISLAADSRLTIPVR